ncbi:disulfide bond formation protein B [Geminicoccaceae bacterium 1502E]|nr:disulfide bond formation protein B [Geminicoccaceae bacterium 1502E]
MPFFRTPAAAALTVAALSLLALAGAFVMQWGFGLAPCHLCVLQRWPYLAAALVAGAGVAVGWPRAGLALAGLALLGDAGIALFHVGVEQGVFALPESCLAGEAALTLEALKAELAAAPARCDQVAGSFLGLSIPGWNALYAGALAVLAATAALRGSPVRR